MPREVLHWDRSLLSRVWLHRSGSYAPRVHHRHEELEFNLVTAGRASYLIGEGRYDLRPGMLIWLYPLDEHLLIDESADYAMGIAVFRPSLVRASCQQPEHKALRRRRPMGPLCRDLRPQAARELEELMARLAQLPSDQPDQINRGGAYLLLRAWWLFQHEQAAALDARVVHPAVRLAHQLLHEGREDTGLAQLAERCGMSPSHLSRLFKQQSGISLAQFRNRQRVRRYLELTNARPELTLMDAAMRCGFGSYPQFHRVFTQQLGVSPMTHRRRRTGPAVS